MILLDLLAFFKKAMEAKGFNATSLHNKVYYHGIRLLTDSELELDNDFSN